MRVAFLAILPLLLSCDRVNEESPLDAGVVEFAGTEFFPRIERKKGRIEAWSSGEFDADAIRELREHVGPGRIVIRDVDTDEMILELQRK